MFTCQEEAIDFIHTHDIEMVDVRFCDLPGVQQHFTVPAQEFIDNINDGLAFDGSSITGFTQIHKSDMKLIPDLSTAFVDPFRKVSTLVVLFSIVDPITHEKFSRDPRQVAAKAEDYLKQTGIADTCYIGAEAEFYLFDSVSFSNKPYHSFYRLDSQEGYWASDRPGQGYTTRLKGGYFPVSPQDQSADIRDDMTCRLMKAGLKVERAHHEVGSGGQQEINYRFNTLQRAGDDMLTFKYVIKNTAWEHGCTATFMPKPLWGDNGSGMHTHMSLWKDGKPLFYDEKGYAGLSDMARYFIGGLLEHAPALLAFTNPSVNSFRRLVPGFEAPVNLVYSASNRSACIRIPSTGSSAAAKRIEYRVPDPSANPYLSFSACLMAGIDGIRNRIEPALPIDKDLYELPPEDYHDIDKLPASLEEALEALKDDHEFLTEGDVFTSDLIDKWLDYKYENDIVPMRQYPHPYEFELYFNH